MAWLFDIRNNYHISTILKVTEVSMDGRISHLNERVGLYYEYSRQSFYEKVFSIRITVYHIDYFTKWISIYICKTESVCLG